MALWLAVAGAAAADRFDDWDQDKNGRLTREELPAGLRKNFEAVDADRSGFITRAEHEAFLGRNRGRRDPAVRDAEIRVLPDLAYAGGGNPRQTLDLFLPKAQSDQRRPLVVFIHGGGWQKGSKQGALGRLRGLLAGGRYAGAAINYRLTDEAAWPAQIHDCKAAIRWLRAHAGDYGYDPEKIAVWGTSAGGHLAAALGVTGDVKALEGALGAHGDVPSSVACVVNYFGPSNLLTMDDHESSIEHNAPGSPESKLLGGPVQDVKAAAREASPATHVSQGDAPMLIAHGTRDRLVPFPQSEDLAARLREAGVPVYLVKMVDAGHGFRSPELDRRVAAFLAKYLRGDDDSAIATSPIPPGR
ncbi:MAG: alpha/beta hydrolase fold domain-containing protein [Akkermansiaceae bacterium]|nr:alpha/beta hydrolase fold domain-containing protein [Akkermansiaceae bacterium]